MTLAREVYGGGRDDYWYWSVRLKILYPGASPCIWLTFWKCLEGIFVGNEVCDLTGVFIK